MMDILIQQIAIQALNGLVLGMILVLVASGLTLIFGIMDIVNFAHGETPTPPKPTKQEQTL